MRKCKNTSPSVTGRVGTDPGAVLSILSLLLLSSISECPPEEGSKILLEQLVPLLRVNRGWRSSLY